jgi:hypothetical protein
MHQRLASLNCVARPHPSGTVLPNPPLRRACSRHVGTPLNIVRTVTSHRDQSLCLCSLAACLLRPAPTAPCRWPRLPPSTRAVARLVTIAAPRITVLTNHLRTKGTPPPTSTAFKTAHRSSPTTARLAWCAHVPLAARAGVCPEPQVDHPTGAGSDSLSRTYLRPSTQYPLATHPSSPTLSGVGKPPPPPLFHPFWPPSMVAHPITISSARTSPRAPSELSKAR